MTGIQPELYVARAAAAVEYYVAAFGANVLHRVGEGDEIVAQLAVGEAVFWVTSANRVAGRLEPIGANGATARYLLVVDDPDTAFRRAVDAGGVVLSAPRDEHGWRVGRLRDPFGHEWEIGKPLGVWPPP